MGDINYHLMITALLAIAPISEVRGAIPYALLVAENQFQRLIGVLIAIGCNMLIPPLAFMVLDLLDKLANWEKTPLYIKKAYWRVLKFGRRRALGLRNESYAALAIFVGIPLPATGAWTGCLVSYILGFDRKKSIIAVELGVMLAASIVLLAAYAGVELFISLSYLP